MDVRPSVDGYEPRPLWTISSILDSMSGIGARMKMYRFLDKGEEINVIAHTEPEARKKAKLSEDATLVEAYTLNEDW